MAATANTPPTAAAPTAISFRAGRTISAEGTTIVISHIKAAKIRKTATGEIFSSRELYFPMINAARSGRLPKKMPFL